VRRAWLPFRVRVLPCLPADSLLPGHSPAQDARCPAVGNRDMSTPISEMITWAVRSPTPGIVHNAWIWGLKPIGGGSAQARARAGSATLARPGLTLAPPVSGALLRLLQTLRLGEPGRKHQQDRRHPVLGGPASRSGGKPPGPGQGPRAGHRAGSSLLRGERGRHRPTGRPRRIRPAVLARGGGSWCRGRGPGVLGGRTGGGQNCRCDAGCGSRGARDQTEGQHLPAGQVNAGASHMDLHMVSVAVEMVSPAYSRLRLRRAH
jgi:hypothetical protein